MPDSLLKIPAGVFFERNWTHFMRTARHIGPIKAVGLGWDRNGLIGSGRSLSQAPQVAKHCHCLAAAFRSALVAKNLHLLETSSNPIRKLTCMSGSKRHRK